MKYLSCLIRFSITNSTINDIQHVANLLRGSAVMAIFREASDKEKYING